MAGSYIWQLNLDAYRMRTGRNPVFMDGNVNMVGFIPNYNPFDKRITFFDNYRYLSAAGGLFYYYDFTYDRVYLQALPNSSAVAQGVTAPPMVNNPAPPVVNDPAPPARNETGTDWLPLILGGAVIVALVLSVDRK